MSKVRLFEENIDKELVAAGHFDLSKSYNKIRNLHKFIPYQLKAFLVVRVVSEHVKRQIKSNNEPSKYLLTYLGDIATIAVFGE